MTEQRNRPQEHQPGYYLEQGHPGSSWAYQKQFKETHALLLDERGERRELEWDVCFLKQMFTQLALNVLALAVFTISLLATQSIKETMLKASIGSYIISSVIWFLVNMIIYTAVVYHLYNPPRRGLMTAGARWDAIINKRMR